MPASVEAVRKLLGSRVNIGGPTDQYGGQPIPEPDVILEINRQYAKVNGVLSTIYVYPIADKQLVYEIVNEFSAGYLLHAHHQNDLEISRDGEYATFLIDRAQQTLDALQDKSIILEGERLKVPATIAPVTYGATMVANRARYNPWQQNNER